ncbi:hypothetical protein JL721_9053 [Aureococcus anophagefferens]|nr:hypothetical protein JL721_9053 [Aureococcus anophagefferens]
MENTLQAQAEARLAQANAYSKKLGHEEKMLAPKKAAESRTGGAPRDATATASSVSTGEKRKRDAAPVVTVKRRGKAWSSRFFGVTWHRENGKWEAQYTDEKGKLIHIALFDDEEAAARAYNAKIAELGLNRKTNPEVGGALVEKPGMSSEFHGVAWFARDETWEVQVIRSKKKLRLKTPTEVIFTLDFNGTRRTIRGRLTTVKYDPSVQNRSAWSYRVDFEVTRRTPRPSDSSASTLVGDDSKFVSCTLAPDEKKKRVRFVLSSTEASRSMRKPTSIYDSN